MALAYSTARFLFDAHRAGASFKKTLTLGRTQLYLRPFEMKKIAGLSGRRFSEAALQTTFGGYADDFLKELLQIESLTALDLSDYQGASLIHDLNRPIPTHLEEQFDAVIDAGTIEHVFNFPVAIANCMKMVRVGGRFFMITAANNHCGHGFYQFSPELFFRVFKERNGFHIHRLLLLDHPFPGLELASNQRIYSVRDPDELGQRVGLVTDRPVLLLLDAERRSKVEIFAEFPQQSDYTALWQSTRDKGDARVTGPHGMSDRLRRIFNRMPDSAFFRPVRSIAMRLAGLYQRHILYSFRNRNFYRPEKRG